MITVAWVLLMIALIVVNILEIRNWKRAKRYADKAIENWKRSNVELEEVNDTMKVKQGTGNEFECRFCGWVGIIDPFVYERFMKGVYCPGCGRKIKGGTENE